MSLTERITSIALAAASIVASGVASGASSAGSHDAAQAEHRKVLRELGLTITLPPQLTELAENPSPSGRMKCDWSAKLGDANVRIALFVLPGADFEFFEPDDVAELLLASLRDPASGDPSFAFERTSIAAGSFGYAPFAAIGFGAMHRHNSATPTGTAFVLGGLLKDGGYAIEARAEPALSERDAQVIADFLAKGIAYQGDERNAAWSDEEALARWTRDAPASLQKKLEPILRTEHYIILTDSSGRKAFGDKMEEFYAAIQKTYPFDEVPGRRRLPVFLFKKAEEYYEFCSQARQMPRDDAIRSRGHASRDYYATWYAGTGDPVDLHEGTHQVFTNRLHLSGGGSWFQEGVAEYMSTNFNVRGIAARAVKSNAHKALAELIRVKSLLFGPHPDEAKTNERPMDPYLEAAFFIEFLHDCEWTKDRFQRAIHALGEAPPNDVAAIERAFRGVYDADIAGIEAQWIEYAKNRR
jgi:hypothetical protein